MDIIWLNGQIRLGTNISLHVGLNMATRSNIGIKVDGGYRFIYSHWDGYPSNNGDLLLNNYTTDEAVNDLINGGDISSLGETLEKTIFYARDRGEKDVSAKFTDSRDEVYQQEWAYVWEDGGWWVKGHGVEWKPLTQKFCLVH